MISFQLSEDDYSATEGPNATIQITIAKSFDVFIANPVTFMVIPLTVEDGLNRGVVNTFEPLNNFSPNRAG